MTVVAVGSVGGAPGATTVAVGLAAAWPSGWRRVLVEADPHGGALVARFDPAVSASVSVADLVAAATRHSDLSCDDAVAQFGQRLWGWLPVVVAHPSETQTRAALAHAGRLASLFGGWVDRLVIVDVGRLVSSSPALPLSRAGVSLLVSRCRYEDVVALHTRADELAAVGCRPWLVMRGRRPYQPEEIASAVGLPLVAVLPDDPVGAAVLCGGAGSDRTVRRSPLWRAVSDLASRLAAGAGSPVSLRPSEEPSGEDGPVRPVEPVATRGGAGG